MVIKDFWNALTLLLPMLAESLGLAPTLLDGLVDAF